jgi:methionyl aminopeptidase
MIVIKTTQDIEVMKESCRLAASVLKFIEPHLKPGIATIEIDKLIHDYIVKSGAKPSTLGYKGYRHSCCTSINEVVCHGIPDSRTLKEGDIINVDVTTYFKGFHGDTSKTFCIGKVSRAARELVEAAEEAMWTGIRAIRPGGRLGDLGEACQSFSESKGYSVVREYCGHGIGRNFHEDPHVTHYGKKGTGPELKAGMVFTVEPMINQGTKDVYLLDDDWTVVTRDKKLSAQFEHTVAIFEDRVEVLTVTEDVDFDPVVWRAEP